jgi:hypothetical protein
MAFFTACNQYLQRSDGGASGSHSSRTLVCPLLMLWTAPPLGT